MKYESGLYVVATPIGNLEDITLRAIEVLKNVDFILAEDTRYSKKLMDHYGIVTPIVSYRDQNHSRIVEKVVEKLDFGLKLALISDSGTPTISDPGFKLVNELKLKGYKVMAIPGASAVISALSVSGLPTDRFTFLGFLPKSDKKRADIMNEVDAIDSTMIIYESPHRLLKLLKQIQALFGSERLVSVAHDLTKLTESCDTAPVEKLIEIFEKKNKVKGEWVVMVEKG